ncbi:27042_t:CDS:2, partial [Racocetra persica]
KIQGSQDEIERLSVLDEFVDQTLSEQIYNTFQDPDSNNHSLFEYTTQNTTKGYFNMETCYQHRIQHMQNLFAEE